MRVRLTKDFLLIGSIGYHKGHVFTDEIPSNLKLALLKTGQATTRIDEDLAEDPTDDLDAVHDLGRLADDEEFDALDEGPVPTPANAPAPLRKPKSRS